MKEFSWPNLTELFSKLKIELLVGIVGLFLVIVGIFAFTLGGNRSSEIEIIPATASAGQASSVILVDVAGAVAAPGVYKLDANARVGQAIEAANGLTADADHDWLAKSLNLAARLSDGAKIYIPRVGENVKSPTTTTFQGGIVANSSTINLNSASQAELEALPGIGPVTAGKIINGRPYSAIEELLTRKIVGKSVYEKIKDKVSIY